MKYTNDYVNNNNKVAIKCATPEEKLEVLQLLTSYEGVYFGSKENKLTLSNTDFAGGSIIARYSFSGDDFSICHTNGTYWIDNGYTEITGNQFLVDNNVLQYEIY